MVKVENISVEFKRRDGTVNKALNEISIHIPKGKIIGIAGESGSGKTTLIRSIVGLQKTSSGKITKSDECKIAMVFQDAVGSLNPRQTIGDAIREVISIKQRLNREEAQREILRLLSVVGLPKDVANHRPGELSGGQCQRASIARSLALKPTLLIGDEPVSALDVSVQARILKLFSELLAKKEIEALLIITHDLAVVSAICDYLYVMKEGKIVEEGIPLEVFANPQSDYTKKLLAAASS